MSDPTRWQFKPPLWAWLLTLATVAAFSMLSLWQIDRSQEKQALLDLYEQSGEPATVRSASELEALERYAEVTLEGHFEPARQFLLDNMLREGQPGFHVWTPFRLAADDTLVIVDRGWIAEADAPPDAPDANARSIRGRINALPRPGFRMAPPPPEGDWPRRIYFPEQADLQDQLGEAVFDGRLLLDADESPGYRRDWQPINMTPERHLGYAFQWGALALAVFLVFLFVNIERVRPNEP